MKRSVLITRPSHQAENLSALITLAGGSIFHLPVFEIQALSFHSINIDTFDYCIFLSANAVTHFFSRVTKSNFHTTFISIGNATQRALLDLGIDNILCPKQLSSEGILALPELHNIDKKNIVIICGENPKPLLQKILSERGAHVHTIFCYRRKNCVYDMEKIFQQLVEKNIDVVVCSSTGSFLQLNALFDAPAHHTWLLQKTLCVISDAMKNLAIKKGFQSVIVADNATDEAVALTLLYA